MYALWLTPDKASNETLSALIKTLSNKFSSPVFEPHVTLLGKIRSINNSDSDLEKNTLALAKQLTPIKVSSSRVDCEDTFYKSLFLEIDHSKALNQANRMAEKMFELDDDFQWKPHLSLLYGEQSKQDKEKAIDNFLPHKAFHMELNTLQLIYGFGLPEEWRVIMSIDLGDHTAQV